MGSSGKNSNSDENSNSLFSNGTFLYWPDLDFLNPFCQRYLEITGSMGFFISTNGDLGNDCNEAVDALLSGGKGLGATMSNIGDFSLLNTMFDVLVALHKFSSSKTCIGLAKRLSVAVSSILLSIVL